MPEEIFRKAIDELAAWLPKARIEFEGRGEPSFHPKISEYLHYAREHFPNCQLLLTTNGDMFNKKWERFKEWLGDLFSAGLNIALLDCYTPARYAEFCRIFPEAQKFFEDGVHPYTYRGPAFKQIILMNAVAGNENIIRKYHNQGGCLLGRTLRQQF